MKKTLFLCCFIAALNSYAQYPAVTIPGSEIRKITSSIIKGQEYELHIQLPGSYRSNSNKKYPVVYLMDSQWDFPLLSAIYGEQYYDGFIPELIIVGVTWGGERPRPDSLRARDYTPTHNAVIPQSGGADAFIAFMKDELFPFIEKNYNADAGKRILMGSSFGGLLTLYALFTHPEMFTGYVSASPAVGWDNEALYRFEKIYYEKKPSIPARVYMTIGSVEASAPRFEKFSKLITSRNYASVHIQSKVLDNTGHSGTKAETYGRGLQYIFERPVVKPDTAVLNKYTGHYAIANGFTVAIKNENNQLVLYSDEKIPLYAAGDADFYSTSVFLNIHFKTTNGKVEGAQVELFGRSFFAKKVN